MRPVLLIALLSLAACKHSKISRSDARLLPQIALLRQHVFTLAHDSMMGRNTATEGQIKAANYIAGELESYGLSMIHRDSLGKKTYFQDYPFVRKFGESSRYNPYAQNVIAMLEGSGKLKEEFIIVS